MNEQGALNLPPVLRPDVSQSGAEVTYFLELPSALSVNSLGFVAVIWRLATA